MIFILYLEAGETELINTCVVPFATAEFGQKCLKAASTLKYEPLNSCITVHSVWIMKIFNVMLLNTCSRNKRRPAKLWRIKMAILKCPCSTYSNACLIDAKISLVSAPQLIVPSTLLALSTTIRTYKVTKIQSHKDTYALAYVFFLSLCLHFSVGW